MLRAFLERVLPQLLVMTAARRRDPVVRQPAPARPEPPDLGALARHPRTPVIIAQALQDLVDDDLVFHALTLAYLESALLGPSSDALQLALRLQQLDMPLSVVEAFATSLDLALRADDGRLLARGIQEASDNDWTDEPPPCGAPDAPSGCDCC